MEYQDDTPSRFECKMCNYSCARKSSILQHYDTDKHKIKLKTSKNNNACACGKAFELRSSLFNHKKTCKVAATITTTAATQNEDTSMSLTVVEKEIAMVAKKTQEIADKNEELMDLKTMVQMLLNDRNTMFDKNHEMMMNLRGHSPTLCK